jgi:hypothetical protein
VRVEITAGATTGRGAPTAPATPITPLDGAVSPQGPTAFAPPAIAPPAIAPAIAAPAMAPGSGGAGVPTPQWPAPAPPFGPPVAIPPSAPPPPMALSPAPIAPGGAPKLYGQKTVDLMIQSAVAASQPGVGPASAAAPSSAAHDTAYIRKVADDAAGKKSRPMVFVLAAVLALFLLTLCGVSGIIAVLWLRAYGGGW